MCGEEAQRQDATRIRTRLALVSASVSMSLPSTVRPNRLASPLEAGSRPVSIFIVVVLPHPFEPRNPNISPRRVSKLTESTATKSPNFIVRSFADMAISPWPSAAPTIVDVSSRDGPSVGGTVVWIHGDNFSSDLVVAFGSIAASDTLVVSPQLIKCTSPPCARRDAQSRHEVPLRLVNAATGAGASLTVPFVYTPEAPPAGLPAELQPELLDRMLKSLVAARAAAGSLGEPALASLFASADTHGVTLDGYASGLQKMISDVDDDGYSF